VLLLVDNRPSDFTRYVLERPDVSVVLLRLDEFADTVPNWPAWGRLTAGYRDATADLPSFDVRADRSLADEAARFTAWAATLAAAPRFFCNPEEHAQDVAHRFAALVGLPHLSERQVRWVRDKAEMKDRFAELGIPAAQHARVTSTADVHAFAATHGWPVVLKPVDSFATIDTYRVEGPAELERLAPRLTMRSWMVEEFVSGQEYQLCALVARGRILDSYLSINPSPLLEAIDGAMNADVTVGSRCPEHALTTRTRALVQRLVDGMQLDHGYLHMEFFLDPDDGTIRMSEIGARLAGCGIPTSHGLAFGFDIFGAALDTYLQRVPELQYTEDRCVGDLLLPSRPGRVVALTPLAMLLELPGVVSVQYDVDVGDQLSERRASNTRSGLVHVAGDSVPEVLARMRAVLDRFELRVA
jgi:biotin carboxylase